MAAIVVQGLRKRYGLVEAVAGISFTVEEGEVFALLGPNGAGKTTTVEILEGHRQRDEGLVSVLAFDPATGGRAFRDRIGIMLQSVGGVDRQLTVGEAVGLFAGLYPHPRDHEEVIDLVGLAPRRGARVGTLSGGERRRLDLALALVGNPDVLFLDEPTTGFDPAARRRAWATLESLRSLGKTILLTTHDMDEAQRLADRVAVIASGRIVALGPPESLGGRDRAEAVIRFRLPATATVEDLPAEVRSLARGGADGLAVRTREPTRLLHALTGWALARGQELEGLRVERPTLEDVYLELTGGAGADGA